MFGITYQLKLYGENIIDEDMLKKKHATHFMHIMLSCRHNIMKKSRPTSSTPFPKANVTSYNRKDKDHASSCGRGHGRDRDQGHGRER
ncbi:hypothetical protein EPI10_007290 [Gossypium australe]|uniref:Uncharacterized protein n=1 Tax=Gossypium australe TaxID=47621 RepID=A0A5B6WWZ3_9ROSI|nr:hypothetical protein EPI10_007290 [Gossypium australe]